MFNEKTWRSDYVMSTLHIYSWHHAKEPVGNHHQHVCGVSRSNRDLGIDIGGIDWSTGLIKEKREWGRTVRVRAVI